jgi:hypothetical protein
MVMLGGLKCSPGHVRDGSALAGSALIKSPRSMRASAIAGHVAHRKFQATDESGNEGTLQFDQGHLDAHDGPGVKLRFSCRTTEDVVIPIATVIRMKDRLAPQGSEVYVTLECGQHGIFRFKMFQSEARELHAAVSLVRHAGALPSADGPMTADIVMPTEDHS